MRGRALRTILPALAALAGLLAPPGADASDFRARGLLDVVVAPHGRAFEGNLLTRGDSPFDAYGLRLFGDAQVDPRLQVSLQLVLRDATAPYVDGAYAIFTPSPSRDLHVLAGKVPWLVGTWAPRTYSNKNPLVGAPLMYQYHTTLLWFEIVPSADALLATAGTGQVGVDYFGYPEGPGMPLVDDSYWDVGVNVTGSSRPLEYAVGVSTGTPGWGTTSQEENSGKSLLARVGLAPVPALRIGISGAYGPYLVEGLESQLEPGQSVGDYQQILAMADLEVVTGHIEVRAEGAYNTWETPTVGDLTVRSGYLELKYAFPFGGHVAGRLDGMWFGEIADSTGTRHPWDANLTRIEAGAGYRFSRAVQGKVIYQRTRYEALPDPALPLARSLVAAQLSVSF